MHRPAQKLPSGRSMLSSSFFLVVPGCNQISLIPNFWHSFKAIWVFFLATAIIAAFGANGDASIDEYMLGCPEADGFIPTA